MKISSLQSMQIIHSLNLRCLISFYMNLKQMQTENTRKTVPIKLDLESQDSKPTHFVYGGVPCLCWSCDSKA